MRIEYPLKEYTCYHCKDGIFGHIKEFKDECPCPLGFGPYNTNGDCLWEK